jgi:hypothetical protein
MYTTATVSRRLTNLNLRTRTRVILITSTLLIVVSATFAHAFLSFNSATVRLSYKSDRSSSSSLSNKTIRGNVYIFSTKRDVREISYYFNPTDALDARSLFATRKQAPFDVAGTDSSGKAFPLRTSTLKQGLNLLVSKVTLNSGAVSHDLTWFTVDTTVTSTTTTTTTSSTTTAATTSTTTTAPSGHGDHSGGQEDCVIGQMGTHGPCIDQSAIPAPRAGFSDIRIDRISEVTRLNGEPGAFRTRCDFSHMNYDDPVLYLNQPGRAHLHSFFGNTRANAFSTTQSLMTQGNSTCSGGILNRSSYWVPTMIESRTGRPITPNDDRGRYNSDLEIYYKLGYQGVESNEVRSFPDGIQIIAGNLASATSPTNGSRVKYWCEGSVDTDRTRNLEGYGIPRCTQGQVLVMHIDFPQCWDGVNLRSSNGRSHMAYGEWGVGCPSTHPVGLPSLAMFVRYRVQSGDTSSWRLSSDKYSNGPGGYSGHADYIFAWPNKTFDTVVNRCYRTLLDCGYQLGDGTGLRDPRF